MMSNATRAKTMMNPGVRRSFFILGSGYRPVGPFVDAHERQVPEPLMHVEPVPDDEVGRDLEAGVGKVGVRALQSLLHQQGAHLQGGRVPGHEVATQIRQRQARVDDVLDHQHVAAAQVDVEVLDDADDTAGLGGAAVGRHGHEVELDGQINGAGEIAHEHEGALEHTDEQRRPPGVVGRDLAPQFLNALLELLLGDHDLAEPVEGREIYSPVAAPVVVAVWHGRGPYSPRLSGDTAMRLAERLTRRPPATSQARTSWRATARTRSTSAALGGCSSRRRRRTARRASGSGAPANAHASVASTSAASASSKSASSRNSAA